MLSEHSEFKATKKYSDLIFFLFSWNFSESMSHPFGKAYSKKRIFRYFITFEPTFT